jgi:dihydrodipicolinate synthase/N-acetylneuraminate lyase
MVKLHGVLAPVVTTFQASNGELDRAAFVANLRAHLEAGVEGVVVAGSTGEAALLDERERSVLIEAAREVLPGDRLLLAGTGAESTRAALRLTKQAAQRGVSAVLVVAPHYYSGAMTAQALSAHYRAIADDSPVPVVLYNIPKYMHYSLTPTLVMELAAHENIIGIKDSSGDLELLAAYINAQSERFTVLTGNASTFAPALAAGARGGILAVALFATALTIGIYEAEQRADRKAATDLQARLKPLGTRIVGELGVPGVKRAMDLVGLAGGVVRSPLQSVSQSDASAIAGLLQDAELLVTA